MSGEDFDNYDYSALRRFFEITGRLRFAVKRQGWVNNRVHNVEYIADHMMRMGLMAALTFDVTTGKRTHSDAAMRMALTHDIQEALAGDLTPGDATDEDKHELEQIALQEILKCIPTESIRNEIEQSWHDYEEQLTETSHFVFDCDKLEMVHQATLYERDSQEIDLTGFYRSIAKGKKTEWGRLFGLHLQQWREGFLRSFPRAEAPNTTSAEMREIAELCGVSHAESAKEECLAPWKTCVMSEIEQLQRDIDDLQRQLASTAK
jgi:putative hydrolase of HD superfamily